MENQKNVEQTNLSNLNNNLSVIKSSNLPERILRSRIFWSILIYIIPYILGVIVTIVNLLTKMNKWGYSWDYLEFDTDFLYQWIPGIVIVFMIPSIPILITLFLKRKTIKIGWLYGFLIYVFINMLLVGYMTNMALNCC